jgi:hypothetical protein
MKRADFSDTLTGDLMRHTMSSNIQPRGSMSTLNQVVQQLQAKRRQTEQELERINLAIRALSSLGGTTGLVVRRKPEFSKAGLARIAAAQRKRWARIKAAQKK